MRKEGRSVRGRQKDLGYEREMKSEPRDRGREGKGGEKKREKR